MGDLRRGQPGAVPPRVRLRVPHRHPRGGSPEGAPRPDARPRRGRAGGHARAGRHRGGEPHARRAPVRDRGPRRRDDDGHRAVGR